jgi:hypothetical protein
MSNAATKICRRCQRDLPLDEFHRHNKGGSKDGRRNHCRDCTAARRMEQKGITPGPRHGERKQAMTAERKAIFLRALAESASMLDAARAASPFCKGSTFGVSSFVREMQVDPEFRLAVENAKNVGIAKLEKELYRRAFEPDRRPIADKSGRIIAEATSWQASNQLALRILEKASPDWVPQQRKQVEATVTRVGNSGHSGIGFVITPRLTAHLNDDEKKALSDLMRKMVECEEAAEERKKQLPAPNNDTETQP